MPKTGTTFIQSNLRYLSNNSDPSEFILYEPKDFAEIKYENKLYQPFLKNNYREILRSQVRRVLTAAKKKIVISAEYLGSGIQEGFIVTKAIVDVLEEFSSDIDINAIIYLRRQDLYIESFYSFLVLMHCEFSFHDFLDWFLNDQHRIDYYKILEEFSLIFSKKNLKVESYDFHQKRNTLIDNFSSLCDLNGLKDFKNIRNNASVRNNDFLSIKLHANRILKNFNDRINFNNFLSKGLAKKDKENVIFFNRSEREDFLSEFQTDNSRIKRDFLSKNNNILFDNDFPEGSIFNENVNPNIVSMFLNLYSNYYLK